MAETSTDEPKMAARMVGAEVFDQAWLTMGDISARTYDANGTEDWPAMVDVLRAGLMECANRGPEHLFGFLLPIAEALDMHRLGLGFPKSWSGLECLAEKVSSDQTQKVIRV